MFILLLFFRVAACVRGPPLEALSFFTWSGTTNSMKAEHPLQWGPREWHMRPPDSGSDVVPLCAVGLLVLAEADRHREVVAAALLGEGGVQRHRDFGAKFGPVGNLADVECLRQEAKVAGEGVAVAHELHAGLQAAHWCAARRGRGIDQCHLEAVNALVNDVCAMDLLGRQGSGLRCLLGLGLRDGADGALERGQRLFLLFGGRPQFRELALVKVLLVAGRGHKGPAGSLEEDAGDGHLMCCCR